VIGAELDDRGDFLGAVSECDSIGGVRRMVGLVFAVVVANHCRSGEAITQELAKLGEQGLVDRLMMKDGCGHGDRRKYRKPTFQGLLLTRGCGNQDPQA
jgi:hypothetical protein